MQKGDIILVPFPFTDLTGNKNRPAAILVENHSDITVSFITSQLRWEEEFDFICEPTQLNGLKKTSLIRLNKLATIDKKLVLGKIGELNNVEISTINNKLKQLFKL